MSTDNLIKMANQIAQYFASEPDQKQAVLGVRNHLQMYWTCLLYTSPSPRDS